MNARLEQATQRLEALLGHAPRDTQGLRALALAGEALHRLAADALDGVDDEEAVDPLALKASVPDAALGAALAGYATALREQASQLPSDLHAELKTALEALGRTPMSSKDGKVALRQVDDVLMLASAAWRAGRLPEAALSGLAAVARQRAQEVGPDVPQLWELASELLAHAGMDLEHPELQEWAQPLSALSCGGPSWIDSKPIRCDTPAL